MYVPISMKGYDLLKIMNQVRKAESAVCVTTMHQL
jgi:hypothetical protein